MMDDLKPYAVFAETVDAGSMSAAARRLRMTPSAVSQTIASLERRFGVTLLHRSTRRLALTEAGERCLPYCRRLVEAASDAAASLEQARDAPASELRVAAPIGFGPHIAPALATVLAEWPKLRLRLVLDDKLIDLVSARIDVALRVGPLPDLDWIAHKLADLSLIICAAPAYIDRHGAPALPVELGRHIWLTNERANHPRPGKGSSLDEQPSFVLRLHGIAGEVSDEVVLYPRVVTSNRISLQQICEQGMGLAVLPLADVRGALQRGSLVQLLPDHRLASRPVFALTSGREAEVAKVRVTLAALHKHFDLIDTTL